MFVGLIGKGFQGLPCHIPATMTKMEVTECMVKWEQCWGGGRRVALEQSRFFLLESHMTFAHVLPGKMPLAYD